MRLNARVRVCLLEGLLVRACMHEVEYMCACLPFGGTVGAYINGWFHEAAYKLPVMHSS